MQIEYGDLGALEGVRCVTTNGSTDRYGMNIMGGGCAREAAERYPWLPNYYGRMLKEHGNHVFLTGPVVCFPVKHQVGEPADLALVKRSLVELETLANLYDWQRVLLPTPGCGLGGLSWDGEVREVAERILDDRFTIVRFVTEHPDAGIRAAARPASKEPAIS